MKQGFPFHPLVDSLFGECLLESWIHLNHSEQELNDLLHKSVFGGTGGEFTFTPNVKKEILLAQVPDSIRRSVQAEDWVSVSRSLLELAGGRMEGQESSGMDVSFELLEWLLSGFESIDFHSILNHFLSQDSRVSRELADQIRITYFSKFDLT